MAEPIGIQFLKRVAVRDKDTWFNIHVRKFIDADRPPIFPGHAHNSVRAAFNDLKYWANHGHCVYLAQGAYIAKGDHKVGPFPNANRHDSNLAGCKNLYMDIDVKEGAYKSTDEALAACGNFIKTTGLPEPTIIVASGTGGLHLYWTLSEIFDKKEFRRMAAQLTAAAISCGLLFDQQCTNDPTRLLRVPGTWNFKDLAEGEPGRPVELLYDSGTDIDIQVMRDVLAPFKTNSQSNKSTFSRTPDTGDDYDAGDLMGGVGEFPPVDIDIVSTACPFIKHTLDTGGADLVGDPQWHLVGVLAYYTDKPLENFHRLCNKNKNYDPAGTDQKFASIEQQHKRTGLGPHMCSTIAKERKECATCPNLHLGTTPLSVPFKRTNGHAYLTPIVNSSHPDLPEPYYRGSDNLIYYPHADDGTEGGGEPLCVFPYQILPHSGFIETGKPYKLSFDTIQGGKQVNKLFDMNLLSEKISLGRVFNGEGLPIIINQDQTRVFVMSYLKLLQSYRHTLIDIPPFGWSEDPNKAMGFSFNGMFNTPSGVFKCKRPGPAEENLRVIGDMQPWRDVADIIITPDRPDLAVIVAVAFAAPLVTMCGEKGFVMGVWTEYSGTGKTAATKLGAAVWGRLLTTGPNSTTNFIFGKAAELRHLPLYHDELKTDDKAPSTFHETIFQMTEGQEKGRAGRDGRAREPRAFNTICSFVANRSMTGEVRSAHLGSDAAALRVFEMEGLKDKVGNNKQFAFKVATMVDNLLNNCGHAGQIYAAFLGQNHARIKVAIDEVQDFIYQQLQPRQEERFWMGAIATIYTGARLANELGITNFPLPEMYAYMVNEWRRMRRDIAILSNNLNTVGTLKSIIGSLVNDKLTRNTLILDKTWGRMGRPPKGFARVLNEPRNDINWGPAEIQISGDPWTLRVSDAALKEWCDRKHVPKAALCHGLKNQFGATLNMRGMGVGSFRETTRIHTWQINVKGTELEDVLQFVLKYDGFIP